MSSWRRWLKRPQTVWLRRIAFQLHLWTGVVLSLYVILLSLTGSVLVYRVELTQHTTAHAAARRISVRCTAPGLTEFQLSSLL